MWLFLKFIWQNYTKNFEKFCISEILSCQRSAAGIFKNLEAMGISLIIYHWKVFFLLISKEGIKTLIILYKAVIYQEMASLIWSVQRSHRYEIMTCITDYDVMNLYKMSRHSFWYRRTKTFLKTLLPHLHDFPVIFLIQFSL